MMDFKDITRNTIIDLTGSSKTKVDKEYKFFFDETGNVRIFKLTDKGFNNNENTNFILGGIVSEREISKQQIDTLFSAFKMSKNLPEIKFKSFKGGSKNFVDLLKNKNFQALLDWILKNNIWIHWESMDNFYYSTTDILDSLNLTGHINQSELFVYKSLIYRSLKMNTNRAIAIFLRNGYPNVNNNKRFIKSILKCIKDFRSSPLSNSFYPNLFEKNNIFDNLIQIFNQSSINNLPFLTKNEEKKLIDEYNLIYQQRMVLFDKSSLYFDHELNVEREISKKTNIYDLQNIKFQFLESTISKAKQNNEFVSEEKHKSIQISDCVVGSLGMFFEFLNINVSTHIIDTSNWNTGQKETYKKWITVLKLSKSENKAFTNYINDEFFVNKIESLIN